MADSLFVALDVGNSETTAGLFRGEELVVVRRIATRRLPREWSRLLAPLADQGVTGVGAAVVVPQLEPSLQQACRELWGRGPLLVSPTTAGILLGYADPAQLGADRLAGVAGALECCPPPLIVVDLGTAVTLDAVSATGEFLGGAILPGPSLAAACLHRGTARLPQVELLAPERAIGRDTSEGIRSGVLWGTAAAVDALVCRFREELGGEATVLATGGWARQLAPWCSGLDRVEEHLVLRGIRGVEGRYRV